MWEIEATDEFCDWYEALTDDQQDAVNARVDLLEQQGPSLPRPGHRPFREIRRGDDDPMRVAHVDALRREAEREQEAYLRTLAELRRARAYTQEQLGASLDVPQSQVSRMERQADLYVSTLTRYVEAMGGQLEIVATFEEAVVAKQAHQVEEVRPRKEAVTEQQQVSDTVRKERVSVDGENDLTDAQLAGRQASQSHRILRNV